VKGGEGWDTGVTDRYSRINHLGVLSQATKVSKIYVEGRTSEGKNLEGARSRRRTVDGRVVR